MSISPPFKRGVTLRDIHRIYSALAVRFAPHPQIPQAAEFEWQLVLAAPGLRWGVISWGLRE